MEDIKKNRYAVQRRRFNAMEIKILKEERPRTKDECYRVQKRYRNELGAIRELSVIWEKAKRVFEYPVHRKKSIVEVVKETATVLPVQRFKATLPAELKGTTVVVTIPTALLPLVHALKKVYCEEN